MKIFLIYKNYILFRASLFYLKLFPGQIHYIVLNKYYLEINVKHTFFLSLIQFCTNQWYSQYKTLSELTAVDYPAKHFRFRVVYCLLSYFYTTRLIITFLIQETQVIPSVISTWPGAGWQEREVWDLFGIYFHQNPDLRRILTDYGFLGHPLRKDFPLTGFFELVYDDRKKQVIYRPVSLAQEFRNFNTLNPWVSLKLL